MDKFLELITDLWSTLVIVPISEAKIDLVETLINNQIYYLEAIEDVKRLQESRQED